MSKSKPKNLPTGKPSGSSHDRRKANRLKAGKKDAFKAKGKSESL